MAQQEEGWPLGLQPLNMRAGLMRNGDFSGSISFNTLLTASPSSSTNSSLDLDTESTGSFFHDKSITLGSLIGVSSIFDLSGRRSVRGKKTESVRLKKRSYKSKIWFSSLCLKTGGAKSPPSLGHFLEVERRATNSDCRRNQSPSIYELDHFGEAQPVSETNLLFINGSVAPPRASSPWLGSHVGGRCKKLLSHANGCGVPILFSRVCGQPTT